MQDEIKEIDGGFKRDLGNSKSLFLYIRMFNNLLAIGDTDNDYYFDDSW